LTPAFDRFTVDRGQARFYKGIYGGLIGLFPRKIRHIKPAQQKISKDFVRLALLIS
jgi:hypothetical protein